MMILSVTINSVLTSVSRIVAGVCLITECHYVHCVGDVDCRGAAAGLSVGAVCSSCQVRGDDTSARPWPSRPSYPEYTRLYQHSRNTFQLMNITRCSLYSPGSACYHHHQADTSSLLVMNQQPPADAHPTSFKLRNFSALLCICSLQRCLIESFLHRLYLFVRLNSL